MPVGDILGNDTSENPATPTGQSSQQAQTPSDGGGEWNKSKTIGIIIGATAAFFALSGILSALLKISMVTVIVALAFLTAIWLATWIRMVDKKHIAAVIFFEKIVGYRDSGPCLVPRLPHCGLVKIPKTRLKLNFDPRLAISKKGKEGKGENEEEFGKQMIVVDAVIYTEFDRNFQSVKNAIERGTPTTEEGLRDYVVGEIDSAFREAIGSMTWGIATEKDGRAKILDIVNERITGANSPFKLGGLNTDKTDVALRVVDLEDKDLKKAISQPDKEKLFAQGAKYEARRLQRETEVVGTIRKKLVEGGFDPMNADQIAHSIYELQVTKGLQVDTGKEVVKLIRFQTSSGGSAIAGNIAEALVAGSAAQQIIAGSAGKAEKTETEEATGDTYKHKKEKFEQVAKKYE